MIVNSGWVGVTEDVCKDAVCFTSGLISTTRTLQPLSKGKDGWDFLCVCVCVSGVMETISSPNTQSQNHKLSGDGNQFGEMQDFRSDTS